MPPKKKKTNTAPDFSFFSSVKTGDKMADSGRKREVKDWIDTGSYTLNAIMSGDMTKGFPSNRAFMFAGEQAVGKTFFAMFAFARPLVEKGYFIYYIDTENSLCDSDLINFGLPEGSFKLISQSVVEKLKGNFDQILEQLEDAMGRKAENPNKCAFVIDSQGMLDTLKSRTDIQNSNYVNDMTAQKQLKSFYKSVLVRLGTLDIPMLITNHVYANIGGYGDPTTVAGGSGGLYASSVILHMTKKQYKEGTIRKGTIITAKNVKSRFCIDGQKAQIYLNWERGLNKWYGMHEWAVEAKLLEKWSAAKFDKKGVVGPEKTGGANFYVIKDPKKPESEWIVCKEKDIHMESTIGTVFDEINEYIKNKLQLVKPIDFKYDDEEEQGIDIDSENLEDAETVVSKAVKAGKMDEFDMND
jgi:RecA/RadA recombinase